MAVPTARAGVGIIRWRNDNCGWRRRIGYLGRRWMHVGGHDMERGIGRKGIASLDHGLFARGEHGARRTRYRVGDLLLGGFDGLLLLANGNLVFQFLFQLLLDTCRRIHWSGSAEGNLLLIAARLLNGLIECFDGGLVCLLLHLHRNFLLRRFGGSDNATLGVARGIPSSGTRTLGTIDNIGFGARFDDIICGKDEISVRIDG
jgi:hypothetical protein